MNLQREKNDECSSFGLQYDLKSSKFPSQVKELVVFAEDLVNVKIYLLVCLVFII